MNNPIASAKMTTGGILCTLFAVTCNGGEKGFSSPICHLPKKNGKSPDRKIIQKGRDREREGPQHQRWG